MAQILSHGTCCHSNQSKILEGITTAERVFWFQTVSAQPPQETDRYSQTPNTYLQSSTENSTQLQPWLVRVFCLTLVGFSPLQLTCLQNALVDRKPLSYLAVATTSPIFSPSHSFPIDFLMSYIAAFSYFLFLLTHYSFPPSILFFSPFSNTFLVALISVPTHQNILLHLGTTEACNAAFVPQEY